VVNLRQRVGRLANVSMIAARTKPSSVLGCTALCLLLALPLAVVERFGQPFTFAVDASTITSETGFSHIWQVPDVGWFYQVRSDTQWNPDVSFMDVFEDGVALGPAHSLHNQIRELGHGRFSHWNGVLRFSSSDNSDPARNGKHYTVRVASSLATSVRAVGVLAFLAGATLFGLWALAAVSMMSAWVRRCYLVVYGRVCEPMMLTSRVSASLLLVGGAAGGAAVVFGWVAGDATQIGLELGRFFPLSDALAYHRCGISLAGFGTFDSFESLCGRRILYPSMLAALLPAVGWSAPIALVVQGLLSGLAATALTLQLARLTSLTAAVVAGVMLSVFVWTFTLGVFMTEVAGFTMGALGVSLLLAFAESKRQAWLGCGMAFLSIALTSRAGAILIIPATLAWITISFWHDKHLRGYLLVAIAGAAAGPALQTAGVWLLGLDPTNTGGNFSTVLYGLSTGSGLWTESYERFRTVFATQSEADAYRIVYAAALQNIREQPGVFLGSLAGTLVHYGRSFFEIGVLDQWSPVFLTLFAAGVARGAMSWRTTGASSLLTAMFLGEVATAPLIANIGTRVFAASMAIRFAICAVGAQAMFDLLAYALRGRAERPQTISDHAGVPALTLSVGLFIVAMMVFPFLPLGRPSRFNSVAPTGRCQAGLDEVISRTGKEAIMITVMNSGDSRRAFDPTRISHQRLQTGRYRATWYSPEIERLQPPVTFIHAVDRSTARSTSLRLLAYEGLVEETSEPRVLCVDLSRSLSLGAGNYGIIREIHPLRP
jgi:hypothetical protein